MTNPENQNPEINDPDVPSVARLATPEEGHRLSRKTKIVGGVAVGVSGIILAVGSLFGGTEKPAETRPSPTAEVTKAPEMDATPNLEGLFEYERLRSGDKVTQMAGNVTIDYRKSATEPASVTIANPLVRLEEDSQSGEELPEIGFPKKFITDGSGPMELGNKVEFAWVKPMPVQEKLDGITAFVSPSSESAVVERTFDEVGQVQTAKMTTFESRELGIGNVALASNVNRDDTLVYEGTPQEAKVMFDNGILPVQVIPNDSVSGAFTPEYSFEMDQSRLAQHINSQLSNDS